MTNNPDDIIEDPAQRRWWLLAKALEHVSHEDALKWAKAAEDFISSGAGTQSELNPPDISTVQPPSVACCGECTMWQPPSELLPRVADAAAAPAIVENVHPDRDDDAEKPLAQAPPRQPNKRK